jgi:hypothetical protein
MRLRSSILVVAMHDNNQATGRTNNPYLKATQCNLEDTFKIDDRL